MSIENTINQEMKKQAIKQMKALKLNKKIIQEFEECNQIYESIGSLAKINKISDATYKAIKNYEKRNNEIVYHIIHNKTETLGEINMLYVTNEKENWKDDIRDIKHGYVLSKVITVNLKLDEIENYENRVIGIKRVKGGLIKVF